MTIVLDMARYNASEKREFVEQNAKSQKRMWNKRGNHESGLETPTGVLHTIKNLTFLIQQL